jgi:hypothetical protein
MSEIIQLPGDPQRPAPATTVMRRQARDQKNGIRPDTVIPLTIQ